MTAVARYRDQETKVAKLANELMALEQTNRARSHRALCTTLTNYGAEDDMHRWIHAQRDTTPKEIQQMLNARWATCQLAQSQERETIPFLVQHSQCPGNHDLKTKTISRKTKTKKRVTTKQLNPEKTQELFFHSTRPRANVVDQALPNNMKSHKQGMFQNVFNKWMDAKLEESYRTLSQLRDSHDDTPASSGGTSDTSSLSVDSISAKEYSHEYDESNNAEEDIPLDDYDEDDGYNDNNNYRFFTMSDKDRATLTMENLYKPTHFVKSLISSEQHATTKDSATKVHDHSSIEWRDGVSKEHLLHLFNNETILTTNFAGDSIRLSRLMQPPAEMARTKPIVKLDKPVFLGFVLQRSEDEPHWGLSFSFRNGVLIVGHLYQDLVKTFTKHAKASYLAPQIAGVNLGPVTFLNAFQNHIEGSHNVKPGDVILSINGRPSTMFPNVMDVTEYINHFELLCVVLLRAQQSPENPEKDQIFGATPPVLNSLEANGLTYLASGGACITNVLQDSCSLETASDLGCHNELHTHSQMTNFEASESMKAESTETVYAAYKYKADKSSACLNTKYTKRTSPLAKARRRSSTTLSDHLFHTPRHSTMKMCVEDGFGHREICLDINSNNFHSWLFMRKREWRKKWTDKKIVKFFHLSQQPVNFLGMPKNPMFEKQMGRPFSCRGFGEEYAVANKDLLKENHLFSSGIHKGDWGEICVASKSLEKDDCAKSYLGYCGNAPETRHTYNNQVVAFPSPGKKSNFDNWLIVRKKQWKSQQRMRQWSKRKTFYETHADMVSKGLLDIPRCVSPSNASCSGAGVDALFEGLAGGNRLTQLDRTPIAISCLFDAQFGICDEILAHCFGFLHHSEQKMLLRLSKATSKYIKDRDEIWHQMCPAKWNLPDRPRKTYFDLYMAGIRKDEKHYREQSDRIIKRATLIMSKGDQVQKIEKLVRNAEKRFGFDINHVPRMCNEHNSILNLAVIFRRSGIVKWLIESKLGMDLESRNKGGFTPLMNAHWSGDLGTFLCLLRIGCDHTKIGSGLYHSRPVALLKKQLLEISIKGRQDIGNILRDFE